MAISSRINSSLKKKRRMGLLKKILYTAVFILFFVSLFILSLTWNKLIIKDISVSGNASVSKDAIISIADSKLNENRLWFVRTDNFFLLRGSEIKNEILADFPKINSVKISFHGLTSIEIIISERTPASVWCAGDLSNTGQCYFMDDKGFIYGAAPQFSGNPFPEYFGVIAGDNPVGQNYFGAERFSEISAFFNKLSDMNFSPEYFSAADEHEYTVGLADGGKIYVNDDQTFDKSLINLQALIDNGYIKTDKSFLEKLNYIDLRFDNKVPFDMKTAK